MKKRSMIIIGAAAVIIVAVAVFMMMGPPGFSKEEIIKDPAAAMAFCNESSGDKQSDCYLQIAEVLALNNTYTALQACLAINPNTDDGDRKNCIEELAIEQEEQLEAIEICNAFGNDSKTKEHCFGGIMANSAGINPDAQLAMCDAKIGMDKDNCYRGVAESFLLSNVSKNIEICNKISSLSFKDSCLNNIIGNPEIVLANPNLAISICSSLTLKANCYNYVAQTISAKDPIYAAEICQNLPDDIQISNCYGNVWFSFESLVLQNADFTVSLCNVLTVKRDDCLRRTAGVFMNTDRSEAAAICRLMSASGSQACLNDVQRG